MKLDAEWITGFVDGEGCFHVGINRHSDLKCGYQVLPEFTVVQHERDVKLLHALKDYFDCGVVRTNHGDRWAYRVRSKACSSASFHSSSSIRSNQRSARISIHFTSC